MGHEERGKEGHPRNPGAAAHPPFLHVCLREVLELSPEKLQRGAQGCRETEQVQQVWSPATTSTQAPWPLNKLFASGEMCHLWLLLWTFVAPHKSTVCFCTLWKVWKAGMCCLLFFLPTLAYVLQPCKSTAKDTRHCSALQENQLFLCGCHCLQALLSRHHLLNPQ